MCVFSFGAVVRERKNEKEREREPTLCQGERDWTGQRDVVGLVGWRGGWVGGWVWFLGGRPATLTVIPAFKWNTHGSDVISKYGKSKNLQRYARRQKGSTCARRRHTWHFKQRELLGFLLLLLLLLLFPLLETKSKRTRARGFRVNEACRNAAPCLISDIQNAPRNKRAPTCVGFLNLDRHFTSLGRRGIEHGQSSAGGGAVVRNTWVCPSLRPRLRRWTSRSAAERESLLPTQTL